jgi:hypothetical protein
MPSEGTREQLETLSALRRKLTAMPARAVSDGFSIRDHDRILYGASGKSGLIISWASSMPILFIVVPLGLLLAVFTLVVISTIRRKGRFGINLQKVLCPKCGSAAPAIRQSANLSQTLWGGWSCPQCGIEIDNGETKLNQSNESEVLTTFVGKPPIRASPPSIHGQNT